MSVPAHIIDKAVELHESRGWSIDRITARFGGTAGGWEWRLLSAGSSRLRSQRMPHDDAIEAMRIKGMTLCAIANAIGKRRSYVQQRLVRIALRDAA